MLPVAGGGGEPVQVGEPPGEPPGGALGRAGGALSRALDVLDARRRTEVALLDSVARLHAEMAAAMEQLRGEGETVRVPEHDVRAATVDELVAASGESVAWVRSVVVLASAPEERRECGRAAMVEGRATLDRVLDWEDATRHLATDVAVAIGEAVLTLGRDGNPRSRTAFRAMLRRRVRSAEAVDRRAARQRREEALAERGSWSSMCEHGTAQLTVVGEATRVRAACARLEAAARRAKAAGDPRTLQQLRSDLHLDLLLVGQLPESATAAAVGGDGGGAAPDVASPPACPPVCTACGAVSTDWFPLPHVGEPVLPPARCTVVVGLDVLLEEAGGEGIAHGAEVAGRDGASLGAALGWIPGFGHLDPEHVRAVATREGSVWRRLVADPVTGHAVAVSPYVYRPTASVARFVRARDGLARDPGSCTEAESCEIDHVVPFEAGGTTTPDNLQCLSRRGHARKTARQWEATMRPDGSVEWTSMLGRTYATEPFDYREL